MKCQTSSTLAWPAKKTKTIASLCRNPTTSSAPTFEKTRFFFLFFFRHIYIHRQSQLKSSSYELSFVDASKNAGFSSWYELPVSCQNEKKVKRHHHRLEVMRWSNSLSVNKLFLITTSMMRLSSRARYLADAQIVTFFVKWETIFSSCCVAFLLISFMEISDIFSGYFLPHSTQPVIIIINVYDACLLSLIYIFFWEVPLCNDTCCCASCGRCDLLCVSFSSHFIWAESTWSTLSTAHISTAITNTIHVQLLAGYLEIRWPQLGISTVQCGSM